MATQNYKKFINKITTATTATPETGEIIVGPDQFYVGLGDGTTYSSKGSSSAASYPKTATYVFAAEDTIDKEGATVNNNVGKAVSDLLASDDFVDGSTIFIRNGSYTIGTIALQDKACRITGEGGRTALSNFSIAFPASSLSRIEIDHLALHSILIKDNTNVEIHDNTFFQGVSFSKDIECNNFNKKINIYNNESNTVIATFQAKTKGVNIYNNTCQIDPMFGWGGQSYITPDNAYTKKNMRTQMFTYGSLVSSNGNLVLATLKKYCSNATTTNYQNIITGTATTDATTTGVNPSTNLKYLRDDDGNENEDDSYTKFANELWDILGQSIYDDNNISWDTLADRKKEINKINTYTYNYSNAAWQIILTYTGANNSDCPPIYYAVPPERRVFYDCSGNNNSFGIENTSGVSSLQTAFDKIFSNPDFVIGDKILLSTGYTYKSYGDVMTGTNPVKLTISKSCCIVGDLPNYPYVIDLSSRDQQSLYYIKYITVTAPGPYPQVTFENLRIGTIYSYTAQTIVKNCRVGEVFLKPIHSSLTSTFKDSDISSIHLLSTSANKSFNIRLENCYYSTPTVKTKVDILTKEACTESGLTGKYKYIIWRSSQKYNVYDADNTLITADDDSVGYLEQNSDLEIYSNFWDVHNEPVIATSTYNSQLDKTRVIQTTADSVGAEVIKDALDDALSVKIGSQNAYRTYKHITFASNDSYAVAGNATVGTYDITTSCRLTGPSAISGNITISAASVLENLYITGDVTLSSGSCSLRDCTIEGKIIIASDNNKIAECIVPEIKFAGKATGIEEVVDYPYDNIIVNNISPATHTKPIISYESNAVQTGVTGKNLIS